jgi:hypothetical protein
MKLIIESNICDLEKWSYDDKKFMCNLEKRYHENCNHENYYHEIPKIYTNKFDTIKWAKVFHMYPCNSRASEGSKNTLYKKKHAIVLYKM